MSKSTGSKNGAKSNGKSELTLKQTKWLEAYLQTGNATEAARQAGYEGSEETLSTIGWENIRKLEISRRIAARVAESEVQANEVIGTLASQMRADITEILTPGGHLDIGLIRDKNLGHLIKKIRTKRYVEGSGKDAEPVEITEVELHSAFSATAQLCKVLGIEKQPGANPVDEEMRVNAACARVMERLGVDRAIAEEAVLAQPEFREMGKIG